MGIRHLARQRALQLLYALEHKDVPFEVEEADFLAVNARRRKGWGPFAKKLAQRTHELREKLDKEISEVLKGWKIDRLAITDRLCLRMALCEFHEFPEIPLRVTIDEYIELARGFGDDPSPQFINGVLDRLARNFRHKDFEASPVQESSA